MKKIIILLVVLGYFASTSTEAQKLDKSEKKKLIAQAKKFKSNPQLLKNILTEKDAMTETVADLKGSLSEAQNQIVALQLRADEMESKNGLLQKEITENQKGMSQLKNDAITKGYRLPVKGVVFRVQIGGYKKRDLTSFIDNSSENIQIEKSSSGVEEITVGQFDDYYKANELKKHMRAMGVKDAWIVPYKDGKRVALKEVVDLIEKK